MTGLQKLGLAENHLSGSPPAARSNMTGLQGLSLQQNRLSGRLPATWNHMSGLQKLYWRKPFVQHCRRRGQHDRSSGAGFAPKPVVWEIAGDVEPHDRLQKLGLSQNPLSGPAGGVEQHDRSTDAVFAPKPVVWEIAGDVTT